MNLHCSLLTALLALGSVGQSHAQVFFNNLGQDVNGVVTLHNRGPSYASDFLTDDTPRTFTSLTAHLRYVEGASTTSPASIYFNIHTDNGGVPGAQFDFLGSLFLNYGSDGLFTTTPVPGVNLQPNTRYWVVGAIEFYGIELRADWMYNTGEATDGGFFSTVAGTKIMSGKSSSGWVEVSTGNPLFSLQGYTPEVPEPQTWVALLATIGTFGTFRWWSRRRFSPDILPDGGRAR